jgi:GNAT superfamily N-acetyltransferase
MSITIRPLQATDEHHWRRLWTLYLTFYERSYPDEIYQATWQKLHTGGEFEPTGLIAENEHGAPVGLVHYFFHRSCHTIENICYLQDLYVDESVRGQGAGRALIEAVYAAADDAGAASVYWMTQDFNAQARHLYDQIGVVTPFIKYQRS